MVPSGDTIEDIGVRPLAGVQVKDDQASELGLGVPATIGVELIIHDEDGVTTTANGGRLGLRDGNVLLPCLRIEIKAVDIGEGSASVVQTTVTTIDIHLAVVEGGTHVGSGRRSTDGRLHVGRHDTVTYHSFQSDLWVVGVGDLHEPAVIKTLGRAGMSTEDEDFFLRGQDSSMLGTSARHLVSFNCFLFPMGIL